MQPAVNVMLELGAAYEDADAARSKDKVEHALLRLMTDLGVPGRPNVSVTRLHGEERPERPLRLTVNGRQCRYPRDILTLVNSSFADNAQASPELLAAACAEIVKLQPSVLLDTAQTLAYASSLHSPGVQLGDPAWLRDVLRPALDLRLSIANTDIVTDVLSRADHHSPEWFSEELIEVLRPGVIEIQIPSDYLQRITSPSVASIDTIVPAWRDELFRQLGTSYPACRLAAMDSEPGAQTYRFRLNHLTTPTYPGPPPREQAVLASVQQLRALQVQDTRPVFEPYMIGSALSTFPASASAAVESSGLGLIPPFARIARSLYIELLINSSIFISRSVVEQQLQRLGDAYPAAARAGRELLPIERLTRVLRSLVACLVPIRNLRVIVERLLEFGSSVSGEAAREFDLDAAVGYVRAGLQAGVYVCLTRGLNSMPIFRLDDSTESLLDKGPIDEVDTARIVDAVGTEIIKVPSAGAFRAVVLTRSNDARDRLWRLLSPELPLVGIISPDDLPPKTQIIQHVIAVPP